MSGSGWAVRVLAVDAAAEQGRDRGPLPAAGTQRVGRDREAVEGAGHLQLRPGGRREPGGAAAPGRLGHPVPGPGKALVAAAGKGLRFTESRPLGGTWALDGLWALLEIGVTLRRLLKGRRLDDCAERMLFALVANRALAPSSKIVKIIALHIVTECVCQLDVVRTVRDTFDWRWPWFPVVMSGHWQLPDISLAIAMIQRRDERRTKSNGLTTSSRDL